MLNFDLSTEECYELELAKDKLDSLNFIYCKEINMINEKVKLSRKENIYMKNKTEHIYKDIQLSSVNEERKMCLDINAAIISKQKIKIKYFSLSSGFSERMVHPYAIIDYKLASYFVGFCEKRSEIILFKISRVIDYLIFEEKYLIQDKFELKTYLKNSFGIYKDEKIKLKLKIEKPMSYIISEKIWNEN